MSYQIITDSSCDMGEELIRSFNLPVLPLTYYIDGVSHAIDPYDPKLDLTEFYNDMREGKVVSTSLPNLADSQNTIKSFLDDEKDILYIGFSSALSGTFESTATLMANLQEDYPERKLVAIDTCAAAGGQAILCYVALTMQQNGASFEEVSSWVKENMLKVNHWVTVEDLMYLFRGGRLSKTSAWAGSLLNIKPIININDEGKLVPLEKVRGRKKSLAALIASFEKQGFDTDAQYPIIINHADCKEEAESLAAEIEAKFGKQNIIIAQLDPVIGAHVGPGTVAVFFIGNGR